MNGTAASGDLSEADGLHYQSLSYWSLLRNQHKVPWCLSSCRSLTHTRLETAAVAAAATRGVLSVNLQHHCFALIWCWAPGQCAAVQVHEGIQVLKLGQGVAGLNPTAAQWAAECKVRARQVMGTAQEYDMLPLCAPGKWLSTSNTCTTLCCRRLQAMTVQWKLPCSFGKSWQRAQQSQYSCSSSQAVDDTAQHGLWMLPCPLKGWAADLLVFPSTPPPPCCCATPVVEPAPGDTILPIPVLHEVLMAPPRQQHYISGCCCANGCTDSLKTVLHYVPAQQQRQIQANQ